MCEREKERIIREDNDKSNIEEKQTNLDQKFSLDGSGDGEFAVPTPGTGAGQEGTTI